MQIDMTDQVRVLIANNEELYNYVLDIMADMLEDQLSDEENISYLADRIEVEVYSYYLSGEETECGDWLIRDALATVAWYTIATDEYGDFLADRGE